MKMRLLFTLLFSFSLLASLAAQDFPYTLQVLENPSGYTPLTDDASSVNNGELWDDPAYVVPIGFDFPIMGMTMDTAYFLDAVGPLLGNGEVVSPVIVPYGSDIIDRGFESGTSQSPIRYETRGEAPNRVFVLEWENAGFFNEVTEGPSVSFINFQLWLYESGIVEVSFGPSNIVNNDDIFDGPTGPLVGFVADLDLDSETFSTFWYLVGDPVLPTVTALTEANDIPPIPSLDSHPPADFLYRFIPDGVSSTQSPKLSHDLRIYPNPVQDVLRFQVRLADQSEDLRLRLTDMQGKTLIRQNWPAAPFHDHELPVDQLPRGLYQLVIEQAGQTLTELVIKM